MRISTQTEDKSLTIIFGDITCNKHDIKIESNGKLNHANLSIGLLCFKLVENLPLQRYLFKIQTDIMDMMSHIATHSRKKNSRLLVVK